MNTTNFYPVFEADQVLTNKHLNNMLNYLEQQDRLTRMKLIGSGIVCGLEVLIGTNNSITVSKGCGLTSQGYLITFCNTLFTYFIPYTTTNFPEDLVFIKQCDDDKTDTKPFYKDEFVDGIYKLLTTDQYNNLNADEVQDTTALSNNTTVDVNKYIVVLFLDAEEESLKNCDTNDCNDKGSQMNFEVKALLVRKDIIDKTKRNQNTYVPVGKPSVTPALHHVELRRYNVPAQDLKSADDVLQAFVALVDDAKLKTIAEVLNYCFVNYYYLLENETTNPFQNVWEQFKKLRDEIIKNNPILIQYFYDFIDDILKAYYEFKYKVSEVSSACCGDEMAFPLHLLLGEATSSTTSQTSDNYRQYFIYSPLFNNQSSGLAEVRLLFTRMKLLISEVDFSSITDFQNRFIKVTPSRYGYVYLSDRCLPYYYKVTDKGKELYSYWSFEKTNRGNERFNLGYNSYQYCSADNVVHPLLYDIERFDFFRIEGHIGKNVLSAISQVKTIQQQNNLPFDIAALSADYIGALVKGDDPQCIIQDLESDYRMLIAEFICKIHDAYCFVARLPYTVPVQILTLTATTLAKATPEDASAIKDTLAFNPGVLAKADHPFTSALVNEFQAVKSYTKGDTLSKLCNSPINTIGSAYILMKGKFINPIVINTDQPATAVQFHAFEFIDAVESMLELVMDFELSKVDTNELKSRNDRFEKEVRTLSLFAISFLETLENADKTHLNDLASDMYLDLLIFNLETLLQLCFVEQVEALKTEYLRRVAQYRLAQNLGYYFKNHGGIEHKAGVPRGGTFLLVYHEERANRLIDKNSLFINQELSNLMLSSFRDIITSDVSSDTLITKTKLLQTAIAYKDPELYTRFQDVLTKYLADCKDLPDDTRNQLTGIINQKPPQPNFSLPDGMVIADFYIPYLCCSNCPPIAYILPKAPMEVIAGDPVCDEAGKSYKVLLTVTGGAAPYTYFINGVQQPDNSIVLPSNSPDTTVVVKDADGSSAQVIIKSHNCCNLPCDGKAENCHYVLWIAKPPLGRRVEHTFSQATLTLTDENGKVTSPDILTIFKSVFQLQSNVVTNENFDSVFQELVKQLNTVVPANFIGNGQPMFSYDNQNQLLVIEKYACQKVSLQLALQMVMNDKMMELNIIYDDTNGVSIQDGTNQMNTKVPKFGCTLLDKCMGTKDVLCHDTLSITSIEGDQETFYDPRFTFKAQPAFDKYFWFFHTCTPIYSDAASPQHILIAAQGAPLVRLIGIMSNTGCFAILETEATIIDIIG